MGPGLTKAEKTIAVAAVAAIAIFFGFFAVLNKKSSLKAMFDSETGINYKMAKPDEAFAEYTLEGRDIDQVYEGLTPAEQKVMAKKKQEMIAKKKEEIKKQEDKKKQSTAAQAQAQAKTKAQQQAKAQAKAAQSQRDLGKSSSIKYGSAAKDSNSYGGAIVYSNTQNQNQSGDETAVKQTKKSFAQWRSEIFANPTNEQMSLFIQAFKKGDVTATEFQAMAQDLLDQNDNKLKGLGLFALRSVPSLASLSELVHVQPSLPSTYQAYVEQAYIKYFLPANLGHFRAALATQDKLLKAKVLGLLQTYLTRLAQGDVTWLQEARDQRSGEVSALSMSSFSSLLPVLATLNNDPELGSDAQAVATLIQSHNTVAQN